MQECPDKYRRTKTVNVKGFEKKEKNTAELTVMVSAEEFEAAVNKAYLKGRSLGEF